MRKNNLIRSVVLIPVFLFIISTAATAGNYSIAASGDQSIFGTTYNTDLGSNYLNPTGIESPVTKADSIWTILKTILQWTYTAFFILAVFFVMLAAYDFLFAGSKPEMVKTARARLLWAAVAIIVALLSVGAAQIVSSFIKT